MIRLKNLLISESRFGQELYHWTSFAGCYKILEQNYIKGSERTVRRDAKTFHGEYGVSFTRDKTFQGWPNRHYPMEACIVVDANKLSNNYKLFPYNDFFPGKEKPNKKESDEMEEKTNRSIENIKKYIKRIELYRNDGGASEKEQLDYAKYIQTYYNTYKGFNIENYASMNDFKKDMFNYIKNHHIQCIIK